MPDAPTTDPGTAHGSDPAPPPRSARRTIGWVAAGTFIAATFGMWLFAFFIYDPGLKVDELADRTFPKAAEPICAAAEARLDRLPPANTAKDAVERADVVDQADEILRSMLDQLRTVAPTGSDRVSRGINMWIDDWETYLQDRVDYAAQLRQDPDTRFTETVKANRQISRAIDGFAEVNRMESCTTPGDVG
ncbi:MAG: hypothetical protein ACOYOP_15170 [Microthrixaceae bacterium]